MNILIYDRNAEGMHTNVHYLTIVVSFGSITGGYGHSYGLYF